MTRDQIDPATELLELHVKHELASLKGAKLRKFLKQEVGELFECADKLTLKRIGSEERVMETIQRVVVNMELGPGTQTFGAEIVAGVEV